MSTTTLTGKLKRNLHSSVSDQVARGLASKVRKDLDRSIFTPLAYGGKGDGTTNDTAAVLAARTAAAAAGGILGFPQGYVFLINDYIDRVAGLRGFQGFGGIIKLASSSSSGLRALAGSTDCFFKDLLIDLNGTSNFGIFAQNTARCHSSGCYIYGGSAAQAGILYRSDDAGGTATTNNTIDSCYVDGTGNLGASGIQIDAHPTGSLPATNNNIHGCRTFGFQYGYSISGANRSQLADLRSDGAERSISIQGVSDCTVNNLYGHNFTGVCVHVVRSTNVRINDCYGYSTAMIEGEGTFQAYKGNTDVIFNNCHAHVPSASGNGPEFMFYAGGSVNKVVFKNCTATGIVYRAYFCLEAAYRDAPSYAMVTGVAAARNKSGVLSTDATGDSADSGFENCVVNGSSARPAFVMTQITAGSLRALTRPIFKNNRVIGTAYSHYLYMVEENAGSLSDGTLQNFSTPPGAAAGSFVVPRGMDHFQNIGGNSYSPFNYWTGTVALLGDWTGTLLLKKDMNNLVTLEGSVDGTTPAGAAGNWGTIPAGFRPVSDPLHIIANNTTSIRAILLSAAGALTHQTAASTDYDISAAWRAA